LTNATASTAPASPDASATTPPPAASASAAPEAKRTYQLIANASALSPHVGKKVELTGTLESQSASAAATPTDPASADSNAPVLRVQSGKIIAASCSE
jgi:hypothetical protein